MNSHSQLLEGSHDASGGLGYDDLDARIENELANLAKAEAVHLPADNPLSLVALSIVERSGLNNREAALLAALLAVGVAARDSCVIDAGGRKLNGALSAIFFGEGFLGGLQYVELPFMGLRRIQEGDIELGKDRELATRLAKQALAQLEKSAAQEREIFEALVSEMHFRSHAEREAYIARALVTESRLGDVGDAGHRAAIAYAKARQESEAARESCGDAARLLHPLVFSEGVEADSAAVQAGRFSIGAGLSCLDPHGLNLVHLVNASFKTRTRMAAQALASFEGNAVILDGSPSLAPWFNLVSRGSITSIKRFLKDSVLVDGGMTTRTILIDLYDEAMKRTTLGWDVEKMVGFEKIVLNLYRSQAQGSVRCYRLSEYAIEVYERFCAEIQQIVLRVHELGPWLEIWPRFLHKLAMLLHIGSCAEPQALIAAESVEVAAGILKKVGVSGLRFMLAEGLLKSPEEIRFDSELRRLVSKVRMKGPLSRRELVRSYAGKRLADLEPVLEVAMRKGLVVEKHGLLSAVRG